MLFSTCDRTQLYFCQYMALFSEHDHVKTITVIPRAAYGSCVMVHSAAKAKATSSECTQRRVLSKHLSELAMCAASLLFIWPSTQLFTRQKSFSTSFAIKMRPLQKTWRTRPLEATRVRTCTSCMALVIALDSSYASDVNWSTSDQPLYECSA